MDDCDTVKSLRALNLGASKFTFVLLDSVEGNGSSNASEDHTNEEALVTPGEEKLTDVSGVWLLILTETVFTNKGWEVLEY